MESYHSGLLIERAPTNQFPQLLVIKESESRVQSISALITSLYGDWQAKKHEKRQKGEKYGSRSSVDAGVFYGQCAKRLSKSYEGKITIWWPVGRGSVQGPNSSLRS